MEKQIVAMVSIGQSPRPDIVNDFTAICGQTFNILDIGALDDLSSAEIAELAPRPGESDLIAKLRYGQVVYLSHERLRPYIERAIAKGAAQGANWAIVSCTGEFSGLKSTIPVLLPSEILYHGVSSLLKEGDKLLLIVPTEGQAREAAERWTKRGFVVSKVIAETPFGSHDDLFDLIKNDPTVTETEGLIADCFGFGVSFGKEVAAFYKKPIFISRKLIAHLLISVHS